MMRVETIHYSRVQLKCDGTWWRTGGKVKGKLANGVGSRYSHTTAEHGVSSITTADAHTSAASSRLNWRPCRFKWTGPFRRKTKSGFCACTITFQTQSTLFRFWPVEDLVELADGPTRCGKVAWGGCLFTWNFIVTWPTVFTAQKQRH